MKFLIDNAVSPKVAEALKVQGFDAVHVRDYGIQSANDGVVFNRAATENRVLISADTDFGFILSERLSNKPSMILFRGEISRKPLEQARILLKNLQVIIEDLEKGSIIVMDGHRIHIRSLPIRDEIS